VILRAGEGISSSPWTVFSGARALGVHLLLFRGAICLGQRMSKITL
jgi:hypothetical protein